MENAVPSEAASLLAEASIPNTAGAASSSDAVIPIIAAVSIPVAAAVSAKSEAAIPVAAAAPVNKGRVQRQEESKIIGKWHGLIRDYGGLILQRDINLQSNVHSYYSLT